MINSNCIVSPIAFAIVFLRSDHALNPLSSCTAPLFLDVVGRVSNISINLPDSYAAKNAILEMPLGFFMPCNNFCNISFAILPVIL